MTIADLNSITAAEVSPHLLACCGSPSWVAAILHQRPYLDAAALQRAAAEIWHSLTPADWREAFSKHPKIGQNRHLTQWSSQEQSGMQSAATNVTSKLADLNEAYFAKFGFIFIVCATGKTAAEMLHLLEERLPNTADQELRIAAAEHAKITSLRLDKLLAS